MSVQSETQDKKTLTQRPSERKSKRWRESRYALQIEIEVSGIDSNGRPYREEAKTTDVSEWGCRFLLKRRLERHDLIALRALGVQPYCNAEAGATVFIVARCQEKDGAWMIGASKIHAEQIWDLRKPPPAEEEATPPRHDAEATQYMSVERMNESELDSLPYGAFQLDKDGIVLKCNRFAADLIKRKKEQTVGSPFFGQDAPYAAVGEFYDRFCEAVRQKKLKQTFSYDFSLDDVRRPAVVTMLFSRRSNTTWVLVQTVQAR